jgi:hypothetical protein
MRAYLLSIIDIVNNQNISVIHLYLQYPLITFTDFPTFSLNVSIDPNSEFETGSVNIHTVIPGEVTYLSFQRPDRNDLNTHNTLLEIVEFGFGSTGK